MHFDMSKWKRYCSPGPGGRVGMLAVPPAGEIRHSGSPRSALSKSSKDTFNPPETNAAREDVTVPV